MSYLLHNFQKMQKAIFFYFRLFYVVYKLSNTEAKPNSAIHAGLSEETAQKEYASKIMRHFKPRSEMWIPLLEILHQLLIKSLFEVNWDKYLSKGHILKKSICQSCLFCYAIFLSNDEEVCTEKQRESELVTATRSHSKHWYVNQFFRLRNITTQCLRVGYFEMQKCTGTCHIISCSKKLMSNMTF